MTADGRQWRPTDRGQATLFAFGVGIVFVLVTVGIALATVEGAFASASSDPTDGRIAASVADRLVAADAAITRRQNVLNRTRLDALTVSRVTTQFPSVRDTAFRIRLGERVLVEHGTPENGATVRRLVLVATETPRRRTVPANDRVSLPRRTATLRFDFSDANVTTVRIGDRVVLHDPNGLSGTVTVSVRRRVTLRVGFGNATGQVHLTSYPTRVRKRTLVVTVDAD